MHQVKDEGQATEFAARLREVGGQSSEDVRDALAAAAVHKRARFGSRDGDGRRYG